MRNAAMASAGIKMLKGSNAGPARKSMVLKWKAGTSESARATEVGKSESPQKT
jgi:hypothetical protein